MKNISAVIIARNEEKMIGEALDSLSFCDEILVIDTGSKDDTIKISEKKGAKVYEVSSNDFSQVRNEGLKRATSDWILYIDADERVTEPLRDNIKYQISNIKYQDFVAFRLKRKNFYYGNHEWPYIEKLERLFKKDKLKGWQGKLHESPIIEGKIGELEGFLFHYTHRDLTSMVNKTMEWSKTEAQLRFNSNHPKMTWWRFPRVMATAFFDSYIRQRGYKAGTVGIIESIYQSFSMFITYAKLWEMQTRTQNSKIKTQK